ncbi:unnamed protein product [Dicrocoelium dendriticum]|nr:unnamed protein product [Dicrocoelium dendriticum]
MARIRIVYAPDARSSGTVPQPKANALDNGRVVDVKRENPNDYLDLLKPKKGPGRMEFNPYLPKTLTPKGQAKVKLMMSVASKQYESLVRRLKRDGTLWEDPDFPASDSSIDIPNMRGKLEWKRPKEINPSAQFFVGGVSRFDIEQGSVGDCWLLAVISSISSYPQLFYQVVPPNQDMQGAGYVGLFRARFWRFGQWVEVLVDDRLPVYRGTTRLAFMQSADDSEFWSPLLEKAYAKLCGCYNNLSGGTQAEAMEDVTGGICETIRLDPKNRPSDLLKQMVIYTKRCCLMGCSVDSTEIEAKLDNGLIAGHAYSVTGVKPVTYMGRQQYLVRCRNPWGGHHEWRGAWSDKAPQWSSVDPREKQELELQFRDDGEFWMSFEDFVSCFSRLEVCHLGLESLEYNQDFRGQRRLEETIFSGQWEVGVNAGGCINNRGSFHTNPQFRIKIEDPDPNDEEQLATVTVGLMQRDVRKQKGSDFETIGFMVYDVPDDQQTLLSRAQLLTKKAIGSSPFSNTREVTKTFRLKPGSYVFIPSTYEPNVEARFVLRILYQVAVTDMELDDRNACNELSEDVIEALKLEDMVLNEDQEIEIKFNQMADKDTKAINALQLQELLNGSSLQDVPGFGGFTKEVCRSMAAACDLKSKLCSHCETLARKQPSTFAGATDQPA